VHDTVDVTQGAVDALGAEHRAQPHDRRAQQLLCQLAVGLTRVVRLEPEEIGGLDLRDQGGFPILTRQEG
jgi:hypothetical protein